MRWFVAIFFVAACTKSTHGIGPAGGTVSLPSGPTLVVPEGALSTTVDITIVKSSVAAPDGALSQVFDLLPAQTAFAVPATLSFPAPAGTSAASIEWGAPGAWMPLSTAVASGAASAQITQLGETFLGVACNSGASCDPGVACFAGTVTCASGSPECSKGEPPADGSSCGAAQVCSGGSCVAACAAGAACTPAAAEDCRSYATTCASTTATPVCAEAGNAPDDAPCRSGVCSGGQCGSTRTVSSSLQTVFVARDGTATTTQGWASTVGTVTGLVIPDSSAQGYISVPVTLDAQSAFSVPGVPVGPYFIQVDREVSIPQADPQNANNTRTPVVERTLYEVSASHPDLSVLTAARADAQFSVPSVTFDLAGLVPWVAGDQLYAISAGANAYRRFTSFSPSVPAGATSMASKATWAAGLPVAAKGDDTWIYQRAIQTVGSGAAASSYSASVAAVHLMDLTVADNGTTINATLSAAPQTGTLPGDFRLSQFAGLAPLVNPRAVPSNIADGGAPALAVAVAPHALEFPDLPDFLANIAIVQPQENTTDADYGALSFGRFLDDSWGEVLHVAYLFDPPFDYGIDWSADCPGCGRAGVYLALVPLAQAQSPIVPELSPPSTPLVNGADAFTFSTGATLQPTLAWSAPQIGTATSYQVTVEAVGVQFNEQEVATVTAVLFDATSFRIPPGVLQAGRKYSGTVVAVQSPNRLDAPVLRQGFPQITIGCTFGDFSP